MTIVALVLGLVIGGGAATRYWRWRPVEIIREVEVVREVEVEVERLVEPEYRSRRFRVVFSTDSGGDARRLWERVEAAGDGKVEFWDNADRRGLKGAE